MGLPQRKDIQASCLCTHILFQVKQTWSTMEIITLLFCVVIRTLLRYSHDTFLLQISRLGLSKLAKTANMQKLQKLWNQNWHKNIAKKPHQKTKNKTTTKKTQLKNPKQNKKNLKCPSYIFKSNPLLPFQGIIPYFREQAYESRPSHTKKDICSFRKYHNRPLLKTVGRVGIIRWGRKSCCSLKRWHFYIFKMLYFFHHFSSPAKHYLLWVKHWQILEDWEELGNTVASLTGGTEDLGPW